MRVLVCGGRAFADVDLMDQALSALNPGPTVVIEGDAHGADRMAGRWTRSRGIEVLAFPARWQIHGRAAGPIRNINMLAEGRPDLVIAFEGGAGTEDMVRRARAAGVEVREVSRCTFKSEDIE